MLYINLQSDIITLFNSIKYRIFKPGLKKARKATQFSII